MGDFLRKRVLVTGGSGFLGSHLCERLLQDGHEVICADNFYTGTRDNTLALLDNPRSCYDKGKRCAETLFFDYWRQHRLRIKVARIFNTYGPRMHPNDGRVVSNFIVQALKGEPITIYGDGNQTRSFCYVSDLIEALVRLMGTSDAVTGPMNLGNPAESTIGQLANRIVALTGSRSTIEYLPLPANDPRQRQPDISLATAAIGWKPVVELEEGLTLTIAYFDKLLAVRVC